jgi:hypothetical protein
LKEPINSRLEVLIDRQRAERNPQYCLDVLDLCNLCGKSLAGERFVIDGEVKGTPQIEAFGGATMGQWAYMCGACFVTRGAGIAWGKGQLYEQAKIGEWLLVAGHPPEQIADS